MEYTIRYKMVVPGKIIISINKNDVSNELSNKKTLDESKQLGEWEPWT